jgi:outer membrane autotransporter protein
VAEGSQTLGVSTLGLRAERDFTLSPGGSALSLDGALGWRHAFGDTTPQSTARFAGGGQAFTVAGTPLDEDTLLVETGLAYDLSEATTLSLGYRGEFGDSAQDNAVNAKLVIRF